MTRKRSLSKGPQNINDNKVSLGTLNIHSNQDKNASLMLNRRNITRTGKDHSSQNINTDMEIIERNKLMIQTSSIKDNKNRRKI